MNDCKWLYADWCHKPERCIDGQELCFTYHDSKYCPDSEPKKSEQILAESMITN